MRLIGALLGCRYGVTHSGLDAMVVRYMDEMTTFVNLPDELAYPNHTR